MRERDEAIQSYFQELLPDEMPLFPPSLKKKKVPSTSTATPPVRPPAPEEREEPATPHADTAASVPKPPAKTATASKRTLAKKDKGKALVRASPRVPAPEATVELDSDDDHDDDMPDAPQPPAPPMEPTIPRRRIKRKANRNISTADLAAEENIASEAEDDGSSTTPEETPNPNPPSSKARYKREAIARIEKEEMLQHSRKDDEHKDINAPIPAYTWTFEPAVPACGRTFLVAEMLQHTGVQNRQSAEKTKQPRYFAAHMAPLQELSPTKVTYKRESWRPLLLPPDPTIVELQARVLLHLGKDRKLKSTATFLGISFHLNCQVLRLGIVRNTIAYSVEHNSWDYTIASIRLK
ncbi:hypothetical protein GQ457_11G023410 [Hibiscus cannabinus]